MIQDVCMFFLIFVANKLSQFSDSLRSKSLPLHVRSDWLTW